MSEIEWVDAKRVQGHIDALRAERDALLSEVLYLRDRVVKLEAKEARTVTVPIEVFAREVTPDTRFAIERCVQCAGSGKLVSPQMGVFECENCDATGYVLMRDGVRAVHRR